MLPVSKTVFRAKSTRPWSRERIEQLSAQELKQLRANAEALGEAPLVALCDEVLNASPKAGAPVRRTAAARAPSRDQRRLVSRQKAFQARGVYLTDGPGSWSGVRKSDGVVVMSIWAGAIVTSAGCCRYLLWAPNADGARPWSDSPAGKERLAHCRQALAQGGAEGLLVYGEPADGRLPEERARSVHGVNPEVVLQVRIEERGGEYWAVWGGKAPSGSL